MSETRMDATSTGPSWGAVLAFGIVTALFGIAIMAWPDITLGVLAILLGIQLIVVGIFDLAGALAAKGEKSGARWLAAVIGVIGLGIGLLILFGGESLGDSLTKTVQILGVILGIYWIVRGAVSVVSGLADSEAPHRGWRLAGGALSIIAGLVVIAWPGKSLMLFTWLMGIWILILGIVMILMAFVVKKAEAAA